MKTKVTTNNHYVCELTKVRLLQSVVRVNAILLNVVAPRTYHSFYLFSGQLVRRAGRPEVGQGEHNRVEGSRGRLTGRWWC